MRRSWAAVVLMLLLGACTTQQVLGTARASCRAQPERCTDPEAPAASRPFGN